MTARRPDDPNALTLTRRAAAGGSGGSVPRTGSRGAGGKGAGSRAAESRGTGGKGSGKAPDAPRSKGPTMDDRTTSTTAPDPAQKGSRWFRPTPVNVKLIYAGYLVSLALPFLAILSAVFAYQSSKQNPPAWLATHYTYQLRTFWIGLAANLIAYALSFIGVGLLLFPLIAIWVVARAVKGLIRVARQDPIEDPNSYFV